MFTRLPFIQPLKVYLEKEIPVSKLATYPGSNYMCMHGQEPGNDASLKLCMTLCLYITSTLEDNKLSKLL